MKAILLFQRQNVRRSEITLLLIRMHEFRRPTKSAMSCLGETSIGRTGRTLLLYTQPFLYSVKAFPFLQLSTSRKNRDFFHFQCLT